MVSQMRIETSALPAVIPLRIDVTFEGVEAGMDIEAIEVDLLLKLEDLRELLDTYGEILRISKEIRFRINQLEQLLGWEREDIADANNS